MAPVASAELRFDELNLPWLLGDRNAVAVQVFGAVAVWLVEDIGRRIHSRGLTRLSSRGTALERIGRRPWAGIPQIDRNLGSRRSAARDAVVADGALELRGSLVVVPDDGELDVTAGDAAGDIAVCGVDTAGSGADARPDARS